MRPRRAWRPVLADWRPPCRCIIGAISNKRNRAVNDEFCTKLYALAARWKARALERVPPEYAGRGLHARYLSLDVEAAGLDSCADELLELLDANCRSSDAAEPRS